MNRRTLHEPGHPADDGKLDVVLDQRAHERAEVEH